MRLDDFCKVVKGHDIVIIYIYTNKIAMKIFKSIKNDLPSYSIQVSPWLVFLQVLAQVICSLLVARLYRSFLSFVFFSSVIWYGFNPMKMVSTKKGDQWKMKCTYALMSGTCPKVYVTFFFFFDFFLFISTLSHVSLLIVYIYHIYFIFILVSGVVIIYMLIWSLLISVTRSSIFCNICVIT